MRRDWDRRAQTDAHFYVAFGRQNQAEEDFLASAADVMPMFEREFERLASGPASQRRALEIGCGPGRLMVPMSRHFGETHGIDISERMAQLARERLRAMPHAHVHVSSGDDLDLFPDAHFDFVYSYIVFQHIPSREIVLNYLREAKRVLRAGGVLCCQLRGVAPLASELSRESETWTGCYFSAGDMAQFAKEQIFPLVAISGLSTQYMWTTFRKPKPALDGYQSEGVFVKDVTSATGTGRCVPARGPGAAISLWIEGMPEWASLADCTIWFSDREEMGCYLSPVSESGGCQLNSRLPEDLVPGEYEVRLRILGQPVANEHTILVTVPPPRMPRVLSVTDGINLTSRYRVETGGAKVVIEDVAAPAGVSFTVAGKPVEFVQFECKDPITSTYEYAFHLADKTPRGKGRPLSVKMDDQELGLIELEVA